MPMNVELAIFSGTKNSDIVVNRKPVASSSPSGVSISNWMNSRTAKTISLVSAPIVSKNAAVSLKSISRMSSFRKSLVLNSSLPATA